MARLVGLMWSSDRQRRRMPPENFLDELTMLRSAARRLTAALRRAARRLTAVAAPCRCYPLIRHRLVRRLAAADAPTSGQAVDARLGRSRRPGHTVRRPVGRSPNAAVNTTGGETCSTVGRLAGGTQTRSRRRSRWMSRAASVLCSADVMVMGRAAERGDRRSRRPSSAGKLSIAAADTRPASLQLDGRRAFFAAGNEGDSGERACSCRRLLPRPSVEAAAEDELGALRRRHPPRTSATRVHRATCGGGLVDRTSDVRLEHRLSRTVDRERPAAAPARYADQQRQYSTEAGRVPDLGLDAQAVFSRLRPGCVRTTTGEARRGRRGARGRVRALAERADASVCRYPPAPRRPAALEEGDRGR